MSDLYKCCECPWVGIDDQMKIIRNSSLSNDVGAEVTIFVCPKCGHDSFYDSPPD